MGEIVPLHTFLGLLNKQTNNRFTVKVSKDAFAQRKQTQNQSMHDTKIL